MWSKNRVALLSLRECKCGKCQEPFVPEPISDSSSDTNIIEEGVPLPFSLTFLAGKGMLEIAWFDLKDKFPSLSRLDYSYWKFLSVVGAAWQATRRDHDGKIIFALDHSLVKELEAWDERWIVGFDNLSTFRFGDITNLLTDEREQQIEDGLGMWMLWSLYNRAPTYDETDSGRVLGGFLSHVGKEWRQALP